MTATVVGGPRTRRGERNEEGHRTYFVKHIVQVDDTDDGPQVVMNASGLPAIGAYWNYGNDVDTWAFCWPTKSMKPHMEKEGDPTEFYEVESTFTTKPTPSKRCQDTPIEDPLSEPQKISGTFAKTTEEATEDRFGNLLMSSSWERFKGPLVEFDVSRPTVVISQNVLSLELPLFTSFRDCVNDAPLWGLPSRCVKLSNTEWSRELYGTCTYYYKRTFYFDINFDTFDRQIVDSGTKCLNGEWDSVTGNWRLLTVGGTAPDASNPSHFNHYKDRNGENATCLLDGNGLPAEATIGSGSATSPSGPVAVKTVQKYNEANLLLLNIPTSL